MFYNGVLNYFSGYEKIYIRIIRYNIQQRRLRKVITN